jgi:hypothetical protein
MPKLHIKAYNNFVSVTVATTTTTAVTAAATTPVTAAAATARTPTDTISSDDYCPSRCTHHCVFLL